MVGRISILSEPSPILFSAIHHTMHKHFDIDELFEYLVKTEQSSANLSRAYHIDERRHRTFVFNSEYFTLRGDDCKTQTWQFEDGQKEEDGNSHHISITRCSAGVALYLSGSAVKKMRNPSRRPNFAESTHGFVYDPFAAWHVLNLQCYSDWRSNVEIHDPISAGFFCHEMVAGRTYFLNKAK